MKLRINNLSFSYDNKSETLANINLDINSNSMVAIIGPNGVGKSTLMKLILGTLKVDDNKIFIDDKDVNLLSRNERSKLISSVSQDIIFSNETVFDSIMIGRITHFNYNPSDSDYNKVYEVIKELGLTRYMFKSVSELSGGEKQKVAIARALVKESKILYLDEITSNLDIKNEIDIIKLIKKIQKEKDLLVLFNIHDLNIALNYFDDFILLNNKTIYKSGKMCDLKDSDITNSFKVSTKILNYDNKKLIIME